MTRDDPGLGDLTELLHDAILRDGAWRAADHQLALAFECLRGGDGVDRAVELRLAGVAAIAVAYDPLWPEQRPSALEVPAEAAITGLDPWPWQRVDLEHYLDDGGAIDDLELAARVDFLHGDRAALAAARHRLVLANTTAHVQRTVAIGFDDAHAFDAGRPLAWRDWAAQYDAWWQRRQDPAGEPARPVEPAASPPRPVAPAEPIVELAPHDVPAALLGPVTAWFEAQHADGAEEVGFVYARAITGWWIEGRRAYVGVAGHEYLAADDGEPAAARSTAWSFALRAGAEGWTIRTWTSE